MISGHDLATYERVPIDVPQEKPLASTIVPLHAELLIKIAIINFSTPAHADRVAAHQTINGCWVKCLNHQLHVFIQFVVIPQITRKSADRKIRERIKLVKHNSEMPFERSLVISLKLRLRRW